MSFILDALKKSELERQRQSEPGLIGARMPARRSRLPIWALLLGVLLCINVIVLSVLLLRNGTAPALPKRIAARAVESAAQEATLADAARRSGDHFSPLSGVPVYAPEVPVTAEPAPNLARIAPLAPQRSLPRTGLRRADPLGHADPLLRADQPPREDDAQAGDTETLPTLSEVNVPSLPELHLDVHVYATKPADRFVYINMRKYHEGNTLPEGPLVEHIRRDGVILNYQGLRFILPRQS